MHERLLKEIGLTNGETRVYLALLKLGENSVGPIAKKADVSLSKIYEILDNLIKKGLVSHIVKNNTKHFLASEPERIIDYLEKKKDKITQSEEEIRRILPSLKAQKDSSEESVKATLFEGTRGIKTFYENVLRDSEKNDEILVMGLPKYASDRHEGYFLDWNKRRAKKGVKIKLIFNSDVKKLGKKREKIKLTKVKYLSEGLSTPAWILIYGKGVATIHLTEEPICVVIKDEKVVKSYTHFFDIFWKESKKGFE